MSVITKKAVGDEFQIAGDRGIAAWAICDLLGRTGKAFWLNTSGATRITIPQVEALLRWMKASQKA